MLKSNKYHPLNHWTVEVGFRFDHVMVKKKARSLRRIRAFYNLELKPVFQTGLSGFMNYAN